MERLLRLLQSIDRKGYPQYKGLKGSYDFGKYQLTIEHVQGDPFAAPSRLSIQVKGAMAHFPEKYYDRKYRKIALEDYLLRLFGQTVYQFNYKANGSGKSGLIAICSCGQEILERSACQVNENSGDIKVYFSVGFPANGRTINSRELEKILFQFLPKCVEQTCFYKNVDQSKVQKVIELADDQECIRQTIKEKELVAFVANGSILPRESGASQKPMKGAVPFISPKSMEVIIQLPHYGEIVGMGIPKGVTLIVGGGYHGKSTLLQALQWSVYPHIQGDGREYVVTVSDAMKIRAEDGRSICNTDISMFIHNLPNKKDTKSFCTLDASGSTSQAANVSETMEMEASLMLMDEDTSAANFMIRDELMEKVVLGGKEPIVPFIRRVRGLYRNHNISTILVAGSCGTFFHVADTILHMDNYYALEITKEAKAIAAKYPLHFQVDEEWEFVSMERKLSIPKGNDREQRDTKIKIMGRDGFLYNKKNVDLRYLEQITDSEQMLGIAKVVDVILKQNQGKQLSLDELAKKVMNDLEKKGFSSIIKGNAIPDLAMPRKNEIYACINRMIQKK